MPNDLPKHRFARLDASALVKTGSATLFAVSTAESTGNDVLVEFVSSADGSGTPVWSAYLGYYGSQFIDLSNFGTIYLPSHLYVKITSVQGPEVTQIVYVWYD